MNNISIFSNEVAMAYALANEIVEEATNVINNKNIFHFVLSGGTTPLSLYSLLSSDIYKNKDFWKKVHFWWGDERNVAYDHADSNYYQAMKSLLNPLGVSAEQVHRIQTELPPKEAAEQYEAEIKKFFPDVKSPRFDLVLLGIGEDGHTASLFPYTSALEENNAWVKDNFVGQKNKWRITLTFSVLNHAAMIFVIAKGSGKAEIIKEILKCPKISNTYPIQFVEPLDGEIKWFLDDKAATLI